MATSSETKSGFDRKFIGSIISYDPLTGEFSRKIRRRGYAEGTKVGRLHKSGYVNISIGGYSFSAHRVAWLLMKGDWPTEDIDHIDRDRSNNSWANLRPASRSQNCLNVNPRKGNSIGVTGVSEFRGKFVASVTIDRKQKQKWFAALDEAIAWRKSMEMTHYGEFSPSLTFCPR